MESLIPIEVIEKKILLIRGHKVMMDRDLADLYNVETRVLNQAVQRNIKRFPEDFMFLLTREEIMRISQIVISSDIKFSKQVRVFTEQGGAMPSGILNSDQAIFVLNQTDKMLAVLGDMIMIKKNPGDYEDSVLFVFTGP